MSKIMYKIGDRVRITHLTWMVYDEEGHRLPYAAAQKNPIVAFVVGAVNRPLGKYAAATGSHDVFSDDYTPATLLVSGTVTLLQCRTRLFGKVLEAQLQHVALVGDS